MYKHTHTHTHTRTHTHTHTHTHAHTHTSRSGFFTKYPSHIQASGAYKCYGFWPEIVFPIISFSDCITTNSAIHICYLWVDGYRSVSQTNKDMGRSAVTV